MDIFLIILFLYVVVMMVVWIVLAARKKNLLNRSKNYEPSEMLRKKVKMIKITSVILSFVLSAAYSLKLMLFLSITFTIIITINTYREYLEYTECKVYRESRRQQRIQEGTAD